MIRTDSHLHTSFSIDSDTDMEVMIKKAISLGLTEITFTDHQDFLPDGSNYEFHIDYNAYIRLLDELKDKYEEQIKIKLGVEIGVMPHLKEIVEEFVSCYPFEFVIGSSHDTTGIPHYTGQFFENKDKETAYNTYFSEIVEDIEKIDCFDVFGHVDYIMRYGVYSDNSLYYKDYSDIIDKLLRALIYKGKGLEINTSGIRYGLGTLHPQQAILKRYRELGGEIVTIGSDAHKPEHIHDAFNIAEEQLKSAGFKAYTLFRNRKPVFIDLA